MSNQSNYLFNIAAQSVATCKLGFTKFPLFHLAKSLPIGFLRLI